MQPAGLLVSPVCAAVTPDRSTCTRWFPSFVSPNASATEEQQSAGTCGHAPISPAHILDPGSCTLGSSTSTGGGGLSACRSYAGTRGEAADLYLYLTSVQDEQCALGAAAWALPCMFDPATNRPLLASANVCPSSLVPGTPTSPDLLVAVLLHEV